MNNELPIADGIGVILLDSQIIHRLGTSNDQPVLDDGNLPVALNQMHTYMQVRYSDKTSLYCQEWMLLVGVDGLVFMHIAFFRMLGPADGQVHEVVVVIDPDMLDGLVSRSIGYLLHLLRLRIVGPHFLPDLERADGFGTDRGGDKCVRGEAAI